MKPIDGNYAITLDHWYIAENNKYGSLSNALLFKNKSDATDYLEEHNLSNSRHKIVNIFEVPTTKNLGWHN